MRTIILLTALIYFAMVSGVAVAHGDGGDVDMPYPTPIMPTATPTPKAQGTSVVINNDVIMGNLPPETGVLCADAEIKGAPYPLVDVLYILPTGTEVQIKEIAYIKNEKLWWAMIESRPPRWVQMQALCVR